MPRALRPLCFALLLLLYALPARPGQAQEAADPTVVLVVRHAEKAAAPAEDPPLTEAGQRRAEALIEVAGAAAVTAAYASQFRRTQDTAAPLAAHQGIAVTTAPIGGAPLADYIRDLAATILAAHPGETVLVVNHSNTVPAIVEALGGAAVPPLTDEDYDDLYLVIIPADGPVRTVHTRYGPPS